MPALVVFGYKSILGGDDVSRITIMMCIFHTIQFLSAIIVMIILAHIKRQNEILKCVNNQAGQGIFKGDFIFETMMYVGISCFLAFIQISADLGVIRASKIGTPTENKERNKRLIPLVKFKGIPMTLFTILIFIHGAYVFNNYHDDLNTCFEYTNEDEVALWCFCYIIFLQGVHILVFISIIATLIFYPLHNLFKKKVLRSVKKLWISDLDMEDSTWYSRFDYIFTIMNFFTFGRSVTGGDFAYISGVLDDFFDIDGTLDVVFSDIIVGLIVLIELQVMRTFEFYRSARAANETKNTQDSKVPDKEIPTGGSLDVKETQTSIIPDIEITTGGSSDFNFECLVSDRNFSVHKSINQSNLSLPLEDYGNRVPSTLTDGTSFDIEESFERISELFNDKKPNKSLFHAINERKKENVSKKKLTESMKVRLEKRKKSEGNIISEGAYYMNYAVAMYSWLLYRQMYPITGLLYLTYLSFRTDPYVTEIQKGNVKYTVENILKKPKIVFHYDNSMRWNEIGFFLLLNTNAKVVFAQFQSSVTMSPYCIAIDHEKKSVVVAIRGTQSLFDAVADLQIEPIHLKNFGKKYGFDGENEYGHRGFVTRAEWLYDDIKEYGILDKLLLDETAPYYNYTLRVLGHSLGAGVACFLALMLRPKYPKLKCICFSPPGCCMSERTATYCDHFLISFVNNVEIIPRASLQNMEKLRNEVLSLISRIKIPKSNVKKLFVEAFHGDEEYCTQTLANKILHSPDNIPETDFKTEFEEFKKLQLKKKKKRSEIEVELFMPGRILHIMKTVDEVDDEKIVSKLRRLASRSAGENYHHIARWADRTDFDEILVASTLLTDHLPDMVIIALQSCAKNYGS